jgi:hypothetical protein
VTDIDAARHLEIMAREGCEIQAVCVGYGFHTMWLSSSEINVVPFRSRPGSFGGVAVTMETNTFNTGIWQGRNILGGIPWECKTGTLDGSDYYFPGPTGYDGPRWEVFGTDANADANGFLTASASGDPIITIPFPLGGAVIQNFGTWQGSVRQLDYSGATLSTNAHNAAPTGSTDVVEDECWELQIEVTSASQVPDVRIATAGDSVLRTGGCIDCSNSLATFTGPPGWSS